MKNRRERKHADGKDAKAVVSPGGTGAKPRGVSPRGPGTLRHGGRSPAAHVARDVPPVDLEIEMLRIELQELLTDDPDNPLPDIGEVLRYIYSREDMTHEERIACRMRIHSSKTLRAAYLEILGRAASDGRKRTPSGRSAPMPPGIPGDVRD